MATQTTTNFAPAMRLQYGRKPKRKFGHPCKKAESARQ